MERAQVIALAVVATAVALLGIRYLGGGDAAPPPDDVTVRIPAVEGGTGEAPSQRENESRLGARRSALVDQLPDQRDTRRDGAADDEADAGRANGGAEVIAGTRRDPAHLGSSGPGRPGAVGGDGGSANTVASRDGVDAAKPAGGGPQPQSGRSSAESPSGDAPPETAPVLLSLPLKGSVDPEQGGSPPKTDGVVIDGDAVEFPADAQYTLPAGGHVNGQAGSIAFDIEPRWDGSDQTNNSLLQIRDDDAWANNLQIVKNLDSLRFVMIDSAGVQTDIVANIADWQANEPHRITATWGDSVMTLYVDGEAVGQMPFANSPTFKPTTPIHVGSDFPGSQYRSADGRISNLTIYGRPLRAGEIN